MTLAFVVFTTQRTGSTYLVDLLDSHPSICCRSELFLAGGEGTPTWGGATDLAFWDEFRRAGRDLEEYLAQAWGARDGIAAVGFKLMYGQSGAHPGVLPALAGRNGRVVHLVRDNLLDMHVSRMVAWERDVYHTTGRSLPPAAVALDASSLVSKLDRMLARRRQAEGQLRTLGLDVHDLCYEDLMASRKTLDAVVRFLGAEPTGLASGLRKVIRRSRDEVITNFGEVRNVLTGTEHGWMLDDGRGVTA